MKRYAVILGFLISITAMFSPAYGTERYCSDTTARTLRVVFYPFIPDVTTAALKVKQLFEDGCPGLDLELIIDPDYYSSEKQKGILYAAADVYEVDSVFFADFVRLNKVQPIAQSVIDSAGPVVPMARKIGTRDGATFGVPHWLCTDFLVYRKDHEDIGSITGFSDARRIFGNSGNRLVVDLKGASTLGELYLSAIAENYGVDDVVRHLSSIDPGAYRTVTELLSFNPLGFGRDEDYHERDGFYQRQFARGVGSAFVGYSETTRYIFTEAAQSCKHGECLSAADIDVGLLPLADKPAKPVAWVDMYMIGAGVSDVKLRDAQAFISFMMQPTTYKQLVIPKDEVPRYLLPARDDIYADAEIVQNAPLYAKFKPIIATATPVTGDNLNDDLRKLGKEIDTELPLNH
jgi:thiamine pyridinylase